MRSDTDRSLATLSRSVQHSIEKDKLNWGYTLSNEKIELRCYRTQSASDEQILCQPRI